MVTLPDEQELLEHVQSSLDDVGRAESTLLSTPDWFIRIASQIATRVHPMGLTSYARGRPAPCADGEFLWDFSAFIEEDELVPEEERFSAQAAIVGEVEWNMDDGQIDRDFEKLLYADSLICFMTFEKRTSDEAARKLEGLGRVARRRQTHARLRGMMRPPAFLLSCWIINERCFRHRRVLP